MTDTGSRERGVEIRGMRCRLDQWESYRDTIDKVLSTLTACLQVVMLDLTIRLAYLGSRDTIIHTRGLKISRSLILKSLM